ncbi:MAG TPA: type II toxin-antitoxin system PrlF family antitoxin [Longimicrobium sp.]|nr:type II toxin-antitoxin system PrlF family antitoxin [Longimicrobium sp.]
MISAPVGDDDDAGDPVLGAFLGFLEKSMLDQPELVQPLTARDVAGLDEMLEGVEVDLEAELGDDDYVLPEIVDGFRQER